MVWSRALAAAWLLGVLLVLGACGTQEGAGRVAVRFAVFGDAEPSPEPDFVGLAAAVAAINAMAPNDVQLVIGVGDLAHRGSEEQYQAVAPLIQTLAPPFHAIYGNEEYGGGVARYLEEAATWDDDPETVPAASYAFEAGAYRFVMAGASVNGREMSDDDIDWILLQLNLAQPRRAVLVTHGAWAGVFDVEPQKGIRHPRFAEVLAHPALAMIISGDLHIDIGSHPSLVWHEGVLHVHAPGLERTKVGEHRPRMRLIELWSDGRASFRVLDLLSGEEDTRLAARLRFQVP